MSDILGSIICDEKLHLLNKDPLEPPYSDEETRILEILQTMDAHTAFCLRNSIEALVIERHIEGLRSGIRFGVRLAGELAEAPPENY